MIIKKIAGGILLCGVALFTVSALLEFTKVSETPRLEKKIGKEMISIIKNTKNIYVSKMEKNKDGRFIVASGKEQLNAEQVVKLKELLINDDHYLFDRQKKCVFIPNLAFQFDGEGSVKASTSCRQIKFEMDDRTVFLDYDVMVQLFDPFCKELTGAK